MLKKCLDLLFFKGDGEAMPRHDKKKRPKAFERSDVSIEFYNINHSDFVKARIELRDKMDDLVVDAAKYYKRLETGDAIHEHAYERAIKQLVDMRDIDSPYSSYCIAYLDKHNHEEFFEGVF